MVWRHTMLVFAMASFASAVIIDRIAIIAGNAIIKDSDIDRDIRVTSLLNNDPLNLGEKTRKASASRLLDQIFIRREIRQGDYPTATLEDADKELDALKKDRFPTNAAFEQALRRYGVTNADLRLQFQWQLTALRFIDVRFRPAAFVSDEEIEKYYQEHRTALRRQFPGKNSLDELREDIRNIAAGEKVNQLFFAWLDEQRKNGKIKYCEESLR
jgi:hypothetical protein